MVQVRGTVHDVTDNPERVERIVVRAVEPRMHGTTYITEEPTQFPVVDGVLDFNVLPGPCAVAFLRNHGATTYEKLLVPDVEEATFGECLDAAALAEEGTKSALERVVRQIQEELGKATPLVDEVRTLRTEVNESKTLVDGYVKDAQNSASEAAASEANAKTSETNAASSATTAESHFNNAVAEAEKAADSAAAAKASETNAASSESKAEAHETNAGESAAAAASSAGDAKGHADRAEQAADPTSLRNEVTQQISDLVDGAPEDLDTIREIAEYAQDNREITDQLNAAIGAKADKSHTHDVGDVTGLGDALSGKSDAEHKHVISDVTGLQAELDSKPTHSTMNSGLNGKADKSHTHAIADTTGLQSALDSRPTSVTINTVLNGKADKSHTHATSDLTDYPGHIVNIGPSSYGKIPVREADSDQLRVPANPIERYHAASKQYVDERAPEIQVVTNLPESPDPSTVYLVTE